MGLIKGCNVETIDRVPKVRRVATSRTTGVVSFRFVPRTGQAGVSIDTKTKKVASAGLEPAASPQLPGWRSAS